MGKRIAGTCYLKVDGDQLEITGGLEAPMMDFTREAKIGSNGVAGFKETKIAPYIKVTAIVGENFPRKKLIEGTDLTATGEFANGDVYTLSGAFLVGETPTNGEEGEVTLEFNGKKGVWQ